MFLLYLEIAAFDVHRQGNSVLSLLNLILSTVTAIRPSLLSNLSYN